MKKLSNIINYLRKYIKLQPRLAIILGSGFGDFVENLSDKITIPYSDIPHFPISTTAGHAGNMLFAKFCDLPIVCLQGRLHRYEGASDEDFKLQIRTLKLLGCTSLLVTNASGSLHADLPPGSLVLIEDHINFQHINPLIGKNDQEFGPRFPAMTDVYNAKLLEKLEQVAIQLAIPIRKVVNFSVMGPCYETTAEIRAYKILGADIINMSTVPEVIIAHHCGLKIMGMSIISNFATGITADKIDHSQVVQTVANTMQQFTKLLERTIAEYFELF